MPERGAAAMASDDTGEVQDVREEQLETPEYASNVLVVMARGSMGGLWRAAGGEISVAELNLPAALADRLGRWSHDFTAATRDENDPGRPAILASFTAEGLVIARAVQAVLGDAYEILFFDEVKLEADAHLTEYLYPAGAEA